MDLKRLIGVTFALLVSGGQCLAGPVTMETQPWPTQRACKICVPVQFGKLDMRLPLASIGKILVINSVDSALHILPSSGAPKESVLFLTVAPDRLLKHYEDMGLLSGMGITTSEQLLDAIGRDPSESKQIATLRKIEGIDAAARYIKTSKGAIHAYWIQSKLPLGSQKVYFVIDGEDDVYLLAGDVTRQFYEAVLANLRAVDVP